MLIDSVKIIKTKEGEKWPSFSKIKKGISAGVLKAKAAVKKVGNAVANSKVGKAVKKVGNAIANSKVGKAAKKVGHAVASGVKKVAAGVKKVGKAVANKAKSVGKAVVNKAKKVGNAVVNGAKKLGKGVVNGVKKVGNAIKNSKVGRAVAAGVKKVGAKVKNAVVNGVKKAGRAVLNGVKNAINGKNNRPPNRRPSGGHSGGSYGSSGNSGSSGSSGSSSSSSSSSSSRNSSSSSSNSSSSRNSSSSSRNGSSNGSSNGRGGSNGNGSNGGKNGKGGVDADGNAIDMGNGYAIKKKADYKPDRDEEASWKAMFVQGRNEKCSGEKVLRFELMKIGISDDLTELRTSRNGGKFYWIKKWGYEQASYLFDFLDPSLRPLVLKDFKLIYNSFKAYPNGDTKDYKDPYNLNYKIPVNLNDAAKETITRQMINFNKNLDHEVYKLSLNAVQINKGAKVNNWSLDKVDDFAKSFIQSYDMNMDGRLSPREFILGSIWQNKKILSSDDCTLCYNKLTDKIDGIFSYIDCNKDGLISSKDIMDKLKNLRRDTTKWNYFSLANQATIRTAVTNDFVLKNMASIKGMLTKAEFRLGVLLGFWDRQTDDYRIIEDDSRNLKSLRWKDNDVVDLMALKYITDKLIADARRRAQQPIKLEIEFQKGSEKGNVDSVAEQVNLR